MRIKIEFLLKGMSLTNLVIFILTPYIFLSWQLPGISSSFDLFQLVSIFLLFLVDLVLVVLFLRNAREYFTGIPSNLYSIVIWIYLVIGFISRLYVSGYTSFVFASSGIIVIFLIPLNSFLFAYFLFKIRQMPIGTPVKGRLTVLIVLNLLTIVMIPAPFLTNFAYQRFIFGYYIPFAIGSFIKAISYFIGGIVYYQWSNNLEGLSKVEQEEDLYPQEQEGNLEWPKQ